MKKGFTLVELLAVIVVLVIIAVIAVPVILGVIEKAKIASAEDSTLGYVDSFEKKMMMNLVQNKTEFIDGTYEIGSEFLTTNIILYKGEGPSKGSLVVEKRRVISAKLCVMGYSIDYANSKANYNMEANYCGTKGEIYNIYTNGTAIYFNPETGIMCSESEAISTTGTKTGCMKWYIFNDSNTSSTINMILDHNTTANVVWNSTDDSSKGPKEILNQLKTDTNSWLGVPIRSDSYSLDNDISKYISLNYTIDYSNYRARLITANEIARITNNIFFDEGKAQSDYQYFYLDSNTLLPPTITEEKSNYGWLTENLDSYDAEYNLPDNATLSYWTATSAIKKFDYYLSSTAWGVMVTEPLKSWPGALLDKDVDSGSNDGLRPVITINKSLIPAETANNIIDDILPPLITGTDEITISVNNTTFDVMNGVTASDNSGEEININASPTLTLGVAGTYIVTYTAEDSSGNISIVERRINIVSPNKAASNGTVIYFNPETGNLCNARDAVSTTGTKTGCMKWYIFNDSNTSSTINMILDHNTTREIKWSEQNSPATGPDSTFLNQLKTDTSSWIGVPTRTDSYSHYTDYWSTNYTINYNSYKARIITAQEIATITGNSSFNANTLGETGWFYFETNNQEEPINVLWEGINNRFSWLSGDRMKCTNYGCIMPEDTETFIWNYWTTTSLNSNGPGTAWIVTPSSKLSFRWITSSNNVVGIRPVITINKSILSF